MSEIRVSGKHIVSSFSGGHQHPMSMSWLFSSWTPAMVKINLSKLEFNLSYRKSQCKHHLEKGAKWCWRQTLSNFQLSNIIAAKSWKQNNWKTPHTAWLLPGWWTLQNNGFVCPVLLKQFWQKELFLKTWCSSLKSQGLRFWGQSEKKHVFHEKKKPKQKKFYVFLQFSRNVRCRTELTYF